MATLAQFLAANGQTAPGPVRSPAPVGLPGFSPLSGPAPMVASTATTPAQAYAAAGMQNAPSMAAASPFAVPTNGAVGSAGITNGSYGMPNGPAPGVAAPGAPNYADEYQKALAASSAGIENQFHMALGDIAQREGLANQAVGQLPGQLNQVYNAGNANMMTGAASMDAAQKASGLNSFMGAGAQMAPLSAAMGQNKATAMSSVPLLALAVQTQMNNERQALSQQHQDALNQLSGQNLTNISDQAKTANAQQYQTQQTQQSQAYDTQKQATSLQQQMTLAQMANDSRVEPKTNMTIGEINQVKQLPQYQNAVALINGGLGTGTGYKNASLKDIQSRYAGIPNLMKVIALEFPGLQ